MVSFSTNTFRKLRPKRYVTLSTTQVHESDNGSDRNPSEPIGTHRNPTKSNEIQQKNPTLRISSDSATRILIGFRRMVGSDQIRSGPVSDGIGLMDLG
jgi:carbamate kinase